jgi:CubicO group peptidase (beta-lactamase class C family)
VVQRQPALQNSPGAEHNYNNTGYALLALVVERVTGEPFRDWMRANVFEPLGMNATVSGGTRSRSCPQRAGLWPSR